MKKEIFYGSNKEGKPVIPRSKALKEAMLAFGDSPWQLVLEKRVKTRSNQQNKYYWSCCINSVLDGLVDVGYPRSDLNSEVVHLMLKDKFLRSELVSDQGEVLLIIRDTKDLSTTEFSVYIDDIIRWSSEFLRISIPLPAEQSMMNFNDE